MKSLEVNYRYFGMVLGRFKLCLKDHNRLQFVYQSTVWMSLLHSFMPGVLKGREEDCGMNWYQLHRIKITRSLQVILILFDPMKNDEGSPKASVGHA